uniref:Uncharacterized protein n=1 Tax=Rhizophora mucronata TaxID=61149 RepID=A0A2P2PEF1_RHIMU
MILHFSWSRMSYDRSFGRVELELEICQINV